MDDVQAELERKRKEQETAMDLYPDAFSPKDLNEKSEGDDE